MIFHGVIPVLKWLPSNWDTGKLQFSSVRDTRESRIFDVWDTRELRILVSWTPGILYWVLTVFLTASQLAFIWDTRKSRICGIQDTKKSIISGFRDTGESRVPGVQDTGEYLSDCSLFCSNFKPMLQPLKHQSIKNRCESTICYINNFGSCFKNFPNFIFLIDCPVSQMLGSHLKPE